MSTYIKPIVLSLGLVAGIALTAQAQTTVTPGPSVASLPPVDQGPRVYSHSAAQNEGPAAAVVPSSAYPGPNTGNGWYPRDEKQSQTAVAPSPQYIGPRPN